MNDEQPYTLIEEESMMVADRSREIQLTLQSLKNNHFETHYARTAAEAKKTILEIIPLSAKVGVGDSATLRQIGVLEELIRRGTSVTNPFSMELTQGMTKSLEGHKLFIQTARETFSTTIFITSSNAVTLDGKIVSIDRAGNRVAATVFGAPKVIILIGRNKIVKDVNEANDRIKNIIAPAHAKRKGRTTPCAVTGKCCDCDSPDRLCNVTVILEKKPLFTDLSVILVDEDLGLGWDPAWNEQRIQKIKSRYYDHTWVFSVPKSR